MSAATPLATPLASPVASPLAFPAASGAQACADWCASAIAADRSAQASSMAAVNAWLMQSQWHAAGGRMASYPLPIASGPAIALRIAGSATVQASAPEAASVMFT